MSMFVWISKITAFFNSRERHRLEKDDDLSSFNVPFFEFRYSKKKLLCDHTFKPHPLKGNIGVVKVFSCCVVSPPLSEEAPAF